MSKKAVNILESYLLSQNWQVEKQGDSPVYRLLIPAGDDQFAAYAQIDSQDFMFYPVAPISVPSERFAAVAEFITRLNKDLWTSDLELDYLTGQVRCKSSFAFKDTSLETQLVENAIYNSIETLQQYLPGLIEVIADETSPRQAAESLQATPAIDPGGGTEDAQLLYEIVNQFFDQENWAYRQLYDYYTRITYAGNNHESYYCYVTMLPSQKMFFCHVGLPGSMHTPQETDVVEWLTWMNYNLKLGYFVYNFAESAMSFVNGLDFYNLRPTTQLLRNVIYPALSTADKYWPYLKQVIDGRAAPREALPKEVKQE